MTREEMINFGEMFLEANPASKHSVKYEFVQKALELLKQEPCKVAIDKEKVFDILRRHHREAGRDVDGDIVPGDYTEHIYDEIKALPPVEPVRKKGKWIMPDKYYDKNIWRKCSVCNTHFEKYHKYISFSGAVTYTEQIANYCKVCGAEMESEESHIQG